MTQLEVWRRLLEALVQGLKTVLPERMSVESDAEAFRIAVDGRVVQEHPIRHLRFADAEGSLELVLANVQDVVIRTLKHGWPEAAADSSPARGDALPIPRVVLDKQEIKLVYGDPLSPALALPTIRLREIGIEASGYELQMSDAGGTTLGGAEG